MKNETKIEWITPLIVLCTLMLACPVTFAASHHAKKKLYNAHTPGYFEAIGAGSVSNVRAANGHLGVTSSETDTLVQTNNNAWNSWGSPAWFRGMSTLYPCKTIF